MASQPSQSFAQRQQSSQQQASSWSTPSEGTTSQPQRRSSVPQSTSSEDSQTVLLNHPSSSESSPKPEKQKERQASPRPKPRTAQSNKEPKKCWICFGDETEDSPTTSQWRSPCPCALKAHEACLLDWVADLESTNSKGPRKIECPQCKAKIRIARPFSPVVEGAHAIERAATRMTLPVIVVSALGTVMTGAFMHGLSSVYLVLGPEDAERVLGIDGYHMNSNWGVALLFVPLTLVFSRTTHLDSLFPVIPIFYFATGASRQNRSLWPPSAEFTMASLPYIRAVYNELWSRFVVPREKAWMKEIKPRAGEDGDGEEQEQEQAPNQGVGVNNDMAEGVNIELDLEVELVDDGEGEEAQQQPEQAAADPPAVPGDRGRVGPNQEGAEGQNQRRGNPNVPPHLQHLDHLHPIPEVQGNGVAGNGPNLIIDIISSARLIIGALAFPTASAATGALLKAALPRTWTTPPTAWDRYPPGFLQSRFGRTVAGGCLFVVLKDAFMLYAKYRLAQDHKHRHIMDYIPKKDKKGRKPST